MWRLVQRYYETTGNYIISDKATTAAAAADATAGGAQGKEARKYGVHEATLEALPKGDAVLPIKNIKNGAASA